MLEKRLLNGELSHETEMARKGLVLSRNGWNGGPRCPSMKNMKSRGSSDSKQTRKPSLPNKIIEKMTSQKWRNKLIKIHASHNFFSSLLTIPPPSLPAINCHPYPRYTLNNCAQIPSTKYVVCSSRACPRPVVSESLHPEHRAPFQPLLGSGQYPSTLYPVKNDKTAVVGVRISGSGGLSRTARETQRKLNHSIIARRILIQRKPGDEDEDEDNKDGDYGSASSRTRTCTKSKTASTSDSTNSRGKDQFKLDILVKTVENMHILLDKVGRLEAELKDAKAVKCSKCIASELAGPEMDAAMTKNKWKRHAEPVANTEEDQRRRRVALPSISSWLPDSYSSPDAFTSHHGRSPFGTLSPRTIPFDTQMPLPASYLPSPPSSTQFAPSVLTSSGAMPVLELGLSSVPGAFNSAPPSSVPPLADSASMFPVFRERLGSTTSTSTSGRDKIPFTARTPQYESTASLLLHISSSPPVFTMARTRKNSMLERVEPMSTPMPKI
ncbi:hypothetical protein BT96DRAFT_1006665 [Gymnopus androsaceus JB14]|uniref:BHLH domain-containing protein n=1 Tax=Gymnopus androsaceus JB14 TaxID=1447944 RepID=A0A6A4GKK6_9AGAR|nr:hypothetical protein BT96DRAFT_1006665 [Gymnopus androsaceus JB14]